MNIINNLTNSPNQSFTLTVSDGSLINMSLCYIQNQSGWFYSFVHPLLTVGWRRLVISPNLLRQFRNFIPFGLYCTSTDSYEPVFIDDFINQRVTIFLLNAQALQPNGIIINELLEVEQNVIG
jgi:hypothetical protein